jgi:hypothetical protein
VLSNVTVTDGRYAHLDRRRGRWSADMENSEAVDLPSSTLHGLQNSFATRSSTTEGTRSNKSRAGERPGRRAPRFRELAYVARQGGAGELLRERPRAANSGLRPTERTREGLRRGGGGRRRRRGEVAVVGVGKLTDLVGVSVRVADRRTERRQWVLWAWNSL